VHSANDKAIVFKAVVKALQLLAGNPRHHGLNKKNTHEYSSLTGPDGWIQLPIGS
jgi:hypothetical protein